jgi:lipoprotein-anchoring transpeptidase ErfK/SrfK
MKTAKRDKELLLKQIKKLESEIYKISDQKGEAINDLHRQSVKLQEEVWSHIGKSPVIMTGNNDNNFYEKGVPWSLSKRTLSAINTGLGTTEQKGLWWMGSAGITITDDLNAGAIRQYLWIGNNSFSQATSAALSAGNTMILFWDSIVSDIVTWGKNIPIQQLRDSARRVLDMKVALGIYTKIGERYTLNPRLYLPTPVSVSEWARASKFWIDKHTAYVDENNKIAPISAINGIKNALANTILDICRIDPNKLEKLICSIHPKMYDSYLAPNEYTLRKQLIIIDKKEQILYAYDLETRDFIQSTPVAIGKGTPSLDAFHDMQVAGDKKTPVGYYMVVQKKDPKRIQETIEKALYDEYGGDDGGMLVLAWPWQPQIAIHGTRLESVWLASSWCVRTDNETIQKMMNSVPLGSMVVITN